MKQRHVQTHTGKKFSVKVTACHLWTPSAKPVTCCPRHLDLSHATDIWILCWVPSEQFQPVSVWFMKIWACLTAAFIPACTGQDAHCSLEPIQPEDMPQASQPGCSSGISPKWDCKSVFPSSFWGKHWPTEEETLCFFWLGFLKSDFGTRSSNRDMKIHPYPALHAWSFSNTRTDF